MKRFLRARVPDVRGPHNPILAEYAKAMEPAHDTLRRSVGSLSMEQYALDQRRAEQATAQANLALVKVLGSQLPLATPGAGNSERFVTGSLDRAKAIQANVVWWRGSYPAYLVGERPTDSRKWREIMLLGAAPDQSLTTAIVGKESLEQMRERSLTVLTTPFSGEELDALHDKQSGQLVIGSGAAGNMPELHVRRTFSSTVNGVPESVRLTDGLSPDMMELYDVETHLNVLATTFGCVEQLDALYAARDAALKPYLE